MKNKKSKVVITLDVDTGKSKDKLNEMEWQVHKILKGLKKVKKMLK